MTPYYVDRIYKMNGKEKKNTNCIHSCMNDQGEEKKQCVDENYILYIESMCMWHKIHIVLGLNVFACIILVYLQTQMWQQLVIFLKSFVLNKYYDFLNTFESIYKQHKHMHTEERKNKRTTATDGL